MTTRPRSAARSPRSAAGCSTARPVSSSGSSSQPCRAGRRWRGRRAGGIFARLRRHVREGRMKPARFDYLRPETLAEVHAALAERWRRRARPRRRPEPGADAVDAAGAAEAPDRHHAPAGARKDQRSTMAPSASAPACGRRRCWRWPELAEQQPLLAAALPWVGHAQTRSRGTVCGSVAHADPSAELPLAAARASGQRRTVIAHAVAARSVARRFLHRPDVDRARGRRNDRGGRASQPPSRAGYAFREFGRRHGDFAIVACAAVADADRCAACRRRRRRPADGARLRPA